jgi:hypothetical protein
MNTNNINKNRNTNTIMSGLEASTGSDRQWVEPTAALAWPEDCVHGDVLTSAQVASWQHRGFALVDGVFPCELLADVKRDAEPLFPAAGSAEARRIREFGSEGRMDFPSSESSSFNDIILHERLLKAISQLLEVNIADIRLNQGELWAKYGYERSGVVADNTDQRMHCDYTGHTLVHPAEWDNVEGVEIIVYLDNVEDCGGATAVVPREGSDDPAYEWPLCQMPGVGPMLWHNDKTLAEKYLAEVAPDVAVFREKYLYPREVYSKYRVGTVLFYRHDTWHRGTSLLPHSRRFVINMTFRRSDCEHLMMLQQGWSWRMCNPRTQFLEKFISKCSADQRTVLGFPKPGHRYWTPKTIAAVAKRYESFGLCMQPYIQALDNKTSSIEA